MDICYKDSFTRKFEKENIFLDFLNQREVNAIWKTVKTNEIKFMGMSGNEKIIVENQVYADTAKKTALIALIDGEHVPVRDTAIKTILDRAAIRGTTLSKLRKPVLARILNECLKIQKGNALIRHADDKISAVHSGDNSYKVLPMPDLFTMTRNWIANQCPHYTLKNAYYEHSIVTAIWHMYDWRKLTEVYRDYLKKYQYEVSGEIIPTLRLTSSDVGISAATLYPALFFVKSGYSVPLGTAVKLDHRNDATLTKFEQLLEGVYGQYNLAIGRLAELASIEIKHPVNCLGSVLKHVGISKKTGMETIEHFKATMDSSTCTAHDLYYGMCHSLFVLHCDGVPFSRISTMDEKIARALTIDWKKHDYPGDFSW